MHRNIAAPQPRPIRRQSAGCCIALCLVRHVDEDVGNHLRAGCNVIGFGIFLLICG